LLDFGIAKLMEPEGGTLVETELTRMAGRPLTVAYASPEQLLGQPLSTASDVYSLGVVFYEMLCGERPYELKVETAAQVEQAILDTEPRAPSRRVLTEATAQARGTTPQALRKQLASDLDAITLRSLGKRPSQRYGSVEALRADIDRWLAGEAVAARTPSALYHLRKFVGRHPVGVSLGVAAITSLVAAAAIAVWQGVQAREESARAVAARDFMLNIFQRADQEKSRGATVTARDLLATGRKDVITRLAGQPTLQAELLHGIAKIQHDMGEYDDADSTYAELVRIYSVLGNMRSAAWAAADHADNAVYMGDLARARTLLKQAGDLPGRPADDLGLKARAAEVEGWIELSSGSAARARDMFEASQRDFAVAFGNDDPRTFGARRALGRTERALLHFDTAISMYEGLRRTATTRSGVLEQSERAAFDWEWVDLLYGAGRYEQAMRAAGELIPRCIDAQGARDQNCLLLLLKNGQTLLRLGLVEQASAELPRIAPMLDDKASAPMQAEAMMLRGRIESLHDAGGMSPDTHERLRALGQSGAEVRINPSFKAAAALTLAEAALRAGDVPAAQTWVARARTTLATGESTSMLVARAYATSLSGIAALLAGDPEQALELLDSGQEEMSTVLGAGHPQVLLLSVNKALALERMGRRAEALKLVSRVEPTLRAAFGSSAPVFARVVRLRERLAPDGTRVQSPSARAEFFN
jgi:tetratricopeptide (TPR) repeat protein